MHNNIIMDDHKLTIYNTINLKIKKCRLSFLITLIVIIFSCVGFMISDLIGKQSLVSYYYAGMVPSTEQKFALQPETLHGTTTQDINTATAMFDGCPAFDQNRAAGCYPRLPPPTPKACRMCSSQIHLAPGADASSSITVSLALDYDCGENKRNDAVVIYVGTDLKRMDRAYVTTKVTQYTSTACMADNPKDCYRRKKDVHFSFWCTAAHFGTYQSDWFHHVVITELKPATRYYYTVEPKPCNEKQHAFSFKTAPPSLGGQIINGSDKSKKRKPENSLSYYYGTKIAITGDPGQNQDTDITFGGIYKERNDIDFFIITGDLSYANRDHRLHDRWFSRYQPILGNIPLMVTPGNHDIETDCCDWSIFKSFEHRFLMPQIQPAVLGHACAERDSAPPNYKFIGTYDYGNSFYSVSIGPSKIIFLNTYAHSAKGSPQYTWFESELTSLDRSETPWLFVVAHGTMYESFVKHKKEFPQRTMKKAMEPLFKQYGVNAFFSGHDHLYARTYPVFDGKRNDRAPMYITIGNGGTAHQHDSLPHNEPWLAAFDWWSYGFGLLTLVNSTHAFWKTRFHNNSKSDFVPGTDSVYLVNYADTVTTSKSRTAVDQKKRTKD